ncbi:hypothetical protein HGRIS_009255 [Hohenbuehelia grisea]|uniref:Uncharacterized protein n=1 Tax=Hohenbuehelia grisea TaxID=104357 RepID=A0ABR3J0L4_9AGAR
MSNSDKGALTDWTSTGKVFEDTPTFISDELICRTQLSSFAQRLLPFAGSTVATLLHFSAPSVASSLHRVKPESCYSPIPATVTLDYLLKCKVRPRSFLTRIRAAGRFPSVHNASRTPSLCPSSILDISASHPQIVNLNHERWSKPGA